MANKGFVAIYLKQQEKCKIKIAYIIYTKRQHKKSNKIKKRCWQGEQDMLLSYCRKAKNENWNQNLKLESKWDSGIWITIPLGKWILKSISEWEIKNWHQYLNNHPCGGLVNG